MSDQTFTVGELKRLLQGIPEDDFLEFDGGLTFNRIKRRDDDLVVLEFAEPQAYLDEEFRKRNPHVQVAFISDSGPADGEPVWSVDVSVR